MPTHLESPQHWHSFLQLISNGETAGWWSSAYWYWYGSRIWTWEKILPQTKQSIHPTKHCLAFHYNLSLKVINLFLALTILQCKVSIYRICGCKLFAGQCFSHNICSNMVEYLRRIKSSCPLGQWAGWSSPSWSTMFLVLFMVSSPPSHDSGTTLFFKTLYFWGGS